MAVKTIIEQLRYNGNKEVKWSMEMQMKLLQSLEAVSLSQLYSKQTYSANCPVIIKIKHTGSTACLAGNYSAHSVPSMFRRGRGLHLNKLCP